MRHRVVSGDQNKRVSTSSPTAAVAKFASAAVISIALVAVALVLVSRTIARDEGVRDARTFTLGVGRSAIVPVLQDGLATGDPESIASLDRVVREAVLSKEVVRVKIWSQDGRILYSDDSSLIGKQFTLGNDELEAFETWSAEAEVSDLSKPENANDRQFKQLLEVYEPVRLPSGTPVLFEAYLTDASVQHDALRILRSFVLPIVGGLAVLLIVQVPLALGLARRLETEQQRREALISQTIGAAEAERRNIASNLHDGVVQRLVGTSLSLKALAVNAKDVAVSEPVEQAAWDLRQAVRELRTLIVDIAPPRLHEEGLAAALDDLTSSLSNQGIEVSLQLDEMPALSENAETLLYRIAQEAVRNVEKHASAKHVSISVASAGSLISIEVTDDGRGFSQADLEEKRQAQHVGVTLLQDLVVRSGGTFSVTSTPGSGTVVKAEVPNA